MKRYHTPELAAFTIPEEDVLTLSKQDNGSGDDWDVGEENDRVES